MKRLRLCLIRVTLGLLALALLVVGAAWASLAMWRHDKLSALETRSAVAQTCAGPVEYESRGAGPAVLVLHGGFGGFDQGQMFLPGLTEAGFRVIAPSRPGYLRTPLSTGETDERQADAMAALLDTLGVPHAAVVGVSAGGPVAIQFALRHPERTDALALACAITHRTVPDLPDRTAPAYWGLYIGALADLGSWRAERLLRESPRSAIAFAYRSCSLASRDRRAHLIDDVLADPERRARFLRLADSTMPLSARLPGLRNDYRRITSLGDLPFERVCAPTLIVHGTDDKAVGIDHARLAASRIPHAELCTLEDRDHLLMLGPQRDAATTALTGFLRAHLSAPNGPNGTPRPGTKPTGNAPLSHGEPQARDLGATGDGSSDDHAALRRAPDATASCLACIRSCQLPDGAFAQVAPAGNAAAPVWIAPYFANFAALALLAGHAHTPNPEDLARVSRWLTWCARHQAPGGYWTDFEGTSASYADTGKVDAWDSSAALFLNVLAGYRRAGGKVQPTWFDAAQRASACLEALTDKDGLTWAKPDYRVKFLLDNVEVCVGWRAAAEVFAAAGATADAERARFRADRLISSALPNYWQPDAGRFSHARLADGTLAPAGPQPYPHGLAQLYGIAFVHPYSSAWSSVNRAYQPDASPSAAFGPEWWLAAATSVSEDDARLWRRRVCQAVAAFDPAHTYLHRYALSALALLDGAQWLQSNAP